MEKDKQFLTTIKNRVVDNLKARGTIQPFILLKNQRPSANNCDGWYVKIAQVRGFNCFAELWFDRFAGHSSRKLQYCLRTEKVSSKFGELLHHLSATFGDSFKIISEDTKDEEQFMLSKALAKVKFGKPVYEDYTPHKVRFYGMYEIDSIGLTRNKIDRLVGRATEFFTDIIETVNGKVDSGKQDYPGVENRLAVKKHLIRERRSHIAILRKQHDDYICSICGFDYSNTYGLLGNEFAEAHHIMPLAANNKIRVTTIDDLVTVCANCHRMLHKMKGKSSDVEQLKRIVRRCKR